MATQVTVDLLKKMCPKTKQNVLEGYIEPLNTVANYYEMDLNPKRLAGFLSQIAHESGGFNFVIENLNYSAKGLMTTLKNIFQPKILPNNMNANLKKLQTEYMLTV